jgi:predicted deacylase
MVKAVSRIATEVDFNKDGKQVGFLRLPHSVHRSAYGWIPIPVACIRNGDGPRVLLMAGNHGDEYEGQIALCKLIQSLDPAHVQGRIIVMPAANLPAALNSARVSPIDQGNLNRAFPGDPNGTPTQQIAWYIDQVIYPMAQYHHDLHSGGSSLDYRPFVSMRKTNNPDLDARTMAALKAFGAPDALVWAYSHDVGFAAQAAIARGVVALGGEFGGCGSVSRTSVAMVEQGLRRLLAHIGIMEADRSVPPSPPTRLWEVAGRDYYVLAPDAGLFEPAVDLGETVERDQLCGHVHFVDNPGRPPVPVHFARAGMVICRRHLGRVERGDCVVHLATQWKG